MPVPVQPQLPPGFQQAQAIIADFQQGTAYRQMIDKHRQDAGNPVCPALRDQEPLDFKMAAKALVRRACTCGVGYVELGFVREYGPRPASTTSSPMRAPARPSAPLTEEAVAKATSTRIPPRWPSLRAASLR
jgi:hypothetical protein